jgi:hypothetical protein
MKIGRTRHEGEALLETNEIVFRGATRHVFAFSHMKGLSAKDGKLGFTLDGAEITLELGERAAQWLEKIRNPKTVLEKLGVRADSRVAILGIEDPKFSKQLLARAAEVSAGRVSKDAGIVFLGATSAKDLRRLAAIAKMMKRDGAVWVVWPKGRAGLKEDQVRAAALAAGLVDVKVVAFSATHSALKLVIPVAKR